MVIFVSFFLFIKFIHFTNKLTKKIYYLEIDCFGLLEKKKIRLKFEIREYCFVLLKRKKEIVCGNFWLIKFNYNL